MKYYQQLDMTDCGAACLAMMYSHYGKFISIANIRAKAGTDLVGTNLKGLILASNEFGFDASSVKGTKDSISKDTLVPFIAHIHIENENKDWVDHFVVVKKIYKNKVEIWDPNPTVKKNKIPLSTFLNNWTGYALFVKPSVDLLSSFNKNESFNSRNSRYLLLNFLPVILPHKKIIIFSLLSSLLLIFLGIAVSFYYKYIFDEVIFAKANFSLMSLSIGVIFITFLQSVIGSIRSVLLAHFSYKSDLHLNLSYLSHIIKLPLTFFESRKIGEILSRLDDLGKVKTSLSSTVISTIMDILMICIICPVLWNINKNLFLISIITVILVSSIVMIFSKIYKAYYSKFMTEKAEVNSYLVESLNGVETIKSLNAEEYIFKEYETRQMNAVNTSWRVNNYGIIQGFLTGVISGVSSVFIFWLGSKYIIDDILSLGTLLSFNALLGYFTGPLMRIVNIQSGLQEAMVAAQRVGEILEMDQEQNDLNTYTPVKHIDGKIEFKNITFRYGSRFPIYENLNLSLEPGSWSAFVGPSGCGKTTLVKLILKFYSAEEGSITIDGHNILDINTNFLRSNIGYVPQKIFLFSGTIAENISMHKKDASLEDIIKAAKRAGAHKFIKNLPKRYNTSLGEYGGGLSGGERQRIAIARALLGNPKLLILDEATSNLDSISEQNIHHVIQSLVDNNITVILIAHRLSTVMECDSIYVMDNGKIVQKGSHNELMNIDGTYKELWNGVLAK